MSGTYLNQKQSSQVFAAVYRERLFMSIFFTKVPDLQPKKRLFQRCFPVSLPNISENLFGWWLLLLKTIHFLCCVDFISKMLLSTLAIFWLFLNIFRANTVSRFWAAVSGSPRQLVDLLLINKAICRKCS